MQDSSNSVSKLTSLVSSHTLCFALILPVHTTFFDSSEMGSYLDCGPIPSPSLLTLKDCTQSHLHLGVFLNTSKTNSDMVNYICLLFFVHIHTGCPRLSYFQLQNSQHFHALYIDIPKCLLYAKSRLSYISRSTNILH